MGDPCYSLMMCFPHIVNIICQHVLKKMSCSLPPEEDDDDDNDYNYDADDDLDLEENQTDINYYEAHDVAHQAIYTRDPIGRC